MLTWCLVAFSFASMKIFIFSLIFHFEINVLFFYLYNLFYYLFSVVKAFEAEKRELKEDEDALPKLLVVGIALIGLGLLIANTALVAWFIIRKRIKGKIHLFF